MRKVICAFFGLYMLSTPAFANNRDCNSLLKVGKILLQQHRLKYGSEAYKKNEQFLKSRLVPSVDKEGEERTTIYHADFDNDGKIETIERNCGSGTGGLCTFYGTLAKGKELEGQEYVIAPQLVRSNGKIFILSVTDGEISPYSKIDTINVYRGKSDGSSVEVCKA